LQYLKNYTVIVMYST